MNPELAPLPGFPNHFLTPDNFVFSMRAKRKLSRRWTRSGWTSRVPDLSGVVRTVHHDSPPRSPTPDPSTVIATMKLAVPPGYSRYLVSPEGAVYRVRSGQVVPVAEHVRGVCSYVNVVGDDNRRSAKNVDYLASLAHPDKDPVSLEIKNENE